MSGSLNRAMLIGHLGRDPEVRHTQDGKPIVTLSIATSESWRDKQTGDRREKSEWHRVVIFNEGLAKVAEQYLKKGARVFIEGQIQTRKWTDKDNVEKYTTEIVLQNFRGTLTMLDKAGGNGGRADDGFGQPAERSAEKPKDFVRDLDDEIPFGLAVIAFLPLFAHALRLIA